MKSSAKKMRNPSGQQCYHYVPRPEFAMQPSLAGLVCIISLIALGGYAVFAWRGPVELRAPAEREAQIKDLEGSNESLAKEIERRREHIRRLNENPAEQELEIRDRLKLVHPNEKVYITGEPEKEKKPLSRP